MKKFFIVLAVLFFFFGGLFTGKYFFSYKETETIIKDSIKTVTITKTIDKKIPVPFPFYITIYDSIPKPGQDLEQSQTLSLSDSTKGIKDSVKYEIEHSIIIPIGKNKDSIKSNWSFKLEAQNKIRTIERYIETPKYIIPPMLLDKNFYYGVGLGAVVILLIKTLLIELKKAP